MEYAALSSFLMLVVMWIRLPDSTSALAVDRRPATASSVVRVPSGQAI
jgi:hypothetical protein